MEDILKDIKRTMYVDGKEQNLLDILASTDENELISVTLKAEHNTVHEEYEQTAQGEDIPVVGKTYIFKVKNYMTKPATEQFDFQTKWNKDVPMPFRIMVGTVTKETKGMIYADCWAEPMETDQCIKCGRALTHPISKLYGLGPECGSHAYINPFQTEEELDEHLDELRRTLNNIKWSGWIIRSAIELCQEVQ